MKIMSKVAENRANKQILIIDDNQNNLDSAQMAIGGLYAVVGLRSASQALQFLKKYTPDLILVDMQMPLMNGRELMAKLKENPRTSAIPVVFLSEKKDVVTEAECLELGALDFIRKPFVPSILQSRIEKILGAIEQQKRLSHELNTIRDQAQRDALTGLFNRIYANEVVDRKLRSGRTGALFMIDMDNFKAINDNYGHDAGDRTLKMFADTLRSYTGDNDVACRIGGDEFVVFIDGVTDKMELADRAAGIITDLCEKLEECKFDTNSSVSLGIALAGVDGQDFTQLYNNADKALYFVKMNGKNSFRFFSEDYVSEEKKGAAVLDIRTAGDTLIRSDHEKRYAFAPGMNGFMTIYQYLHRRGGMDMRLLLLDLQPDEGAEPSEDAVKTSADTLESVLKRQLIVSDAYVRYSDCQFLILMRDEGEEAAANMVGSLALEYNSLLPNSRIHVFYETAEVGKGGKK